MNSAVKWYIETIWCFYMKLNIVLTGTIKYMNYIHHYDKLATGDKIELRNI
jgi:hypothetical protein